MYTDILFDMDDTLLDFQKAQLYRFMDVMAYYDIQYTHKIYKEYTDINHKLWTDFEQGKAEKDIIQIERFSLLFNSLNNRADGKEANKIYQQSLSKQVWLIPYADEVCAKLSEMCTLAIITNGVGMTQRQRISSSAISPYFKNIIISEDIGVAKPHKEFFDYVFASLAFSNTESILLVGDSLSSDIRGANNVNIDACWFNPQLKPLPFDYIAKYNIFDLRQLFNIVSVG